MNLEVEDYVGLTKQVRGDEIEAVISGETNLHTNLDICRKTIEYYSWGNEDEIHSYKVSGKTLETI